ncbi:hypothetical protein Aperf_G00000044157 [Anoplocephala perfoliata]
MALPSPPHFGHACFSIPAYTPWGHPHTKWMLNTFRSRADVRLSAMSKEHPELFQQIFQLPDTPEKITCDNGDSEAMYTRKTILYLRPLSLAVYMRRLDIIRLLLDSNLADNSEISYIVDYCGISENEVELREIRPATIAVRRNILEALPVLFNKESQPLKAFDMFALRYANKSMVRSNKFRDVFDYTISVVRRNRILPTARVLETLVLRCPGYYSANSERMMCEKHGGRRCSLYQRLAKYLLGEAKGNRLALPLVQSLTQLIHLKGFYKQSKNHKQVWRQHYSFSNISEHWDTIPFVLKDRLTTLGIMFKVHELLAGKANPSILTECSRLISKMVISIGCQEDLMATPIPELKLSIQFLLDFSLGRNILDEENLDQTQAQKPISLDGIKCPKAPMKKALKAMLKGLKAHISKLTVDLPRIVSYESNDSLIEPERCPKCTQEVKEITIPLDPEGDINYEMKREDTEQKTAKMHIVEQLSYSKAEEALIPKKSVSQERRPACNLISYEMKRDDTDTKLRAKDELLDAKTEELLIQKDNTSQEKVSEKSFEATLPHSVSNLIVAPLIEENSDISQLLCSIETEDESSAIADTYEVGKLVVQRPEKRGTEMNAAETFCNADDESVSSERLASTQSLREPCNLVYVDDLIDKIDNSAAISGDFILSNEDSTLIDGMIDERMDSSELDTTMNLGMQRQTNLIGTPIV